MHRKLFSFFALLILLLTSCELQEPIETNPTPAARYAECTPEIRWFDLDFWPIGPSAYMVDLETGPFIVKSCMCNIFEFQLFVSHNSASQWDLTLDGGQVVPFNSQISGSLDLLTINDIGPIFAGMGDQGSGLMRSIAEGSVPVTNAALSNAGGLCIIENYDGTGTFHPVGSTATGPIVIFQPGQVSGSVVIKVYIPEEITDPI